MYLFDPEELSYVEWFFFCFVCIVAIMAICQAIAMFYHPSISY
jgi:hypothetical protein